MSEKFLKLIHLNEAVGTLRELMTDLTVPSETVEISKSLGRVAADDIKAPADMPGFERSAMDGFAVKASDTFGAGESLPAYLNITGEIKMGKPAELQIKEGETLKISTGGMMPPGADAVVMVENTEVDGNTVEIFKGVAPGENVILKDEDISRGSVLVFKGTTIIPPLIGALTGLGINTIAVFGMPTVGIISTGDEVIPPDWEPSPGQVRDINTYLLQAAVEKAGCVPKSYGITEDEFETLFDTAQRALDECDCLLISGGSSMGTRDVTMEVLEKLGRPGLLAHGLYLKPGKPTLVAYCRERPVFGLPGNPGSALSVFNELVLPILELLRGRISTGIPRGARVVEAVLELSVSSATGRMELAPVSLRVENDTIIARPIFGKSNLIGTLARAQGNVRIPEGTEGLEAGVNITVELMD